MKKILYILAIPLLFSSLLLAQVPIPVADQASPILLKGGVAHLGNGQVIQNSLIGFDKGKLTIVADAGSSVSQSGYTVIDITGKQVYPGFILPNSQLGLVEVASVRAMNDDAEQGVFNPNVRSVISYNTDSENIPTMRFNGILLAEATPTGGTISGSSSVMELEGWNWEDACHTMDIGIHLNWPARMSRQFDFNTFTVSTVPNKDYDSQVTAIKSHFGDAVAYGQLPQKEVNLKLVAMQGLFDGSKVLFIHTDAAKEMIEGIRLAQQSGVKKVTLVGGADALHIADFLVENNIPVILPPTHSLPDRPDQVIDLPYELPHLLTEAGVQVSLSHTGMLANARNLPFYAGTAVAYGMKKEEALKTITSNTAKALGIDARVGTLEVGKDASLFVSEGDALDIRTNILSHAFISGKQVVLPNKQEALFKRYSDKYGHK
ncbi:MAG: amidohydrolase family protein [Saprospiraceae bacterium]